MRALRLSRETEVDNTNKKESTYLSHKCFRFVVSPYLFNVIHLLSISFYIGSVLKTLLLVLCAGYVIFISLNSWFSGRRRDQTTGSFKDTEAKEDCC